MSKTKIIFYVLFIAFGLSRISLPDEYKLIHGVIHMDSNVSGGELSLEEMLKLAINDGMKYAIFTDHDTMRWEYGLRPIRKIIRKVIEKGSVLRYGAERYVSDIDELDAKYPEIVAMHGAEAIPFYYWEGGYFIGDLSLVNGHEHLIVFGFDNASDYADMPSIGNGYPRRFTRAGIMSLWPLAFLFLGWKFVFFKRIKGIQTAKALIKKETKPLKIAGIAFFVFAAIFLFNNAPFSTPLYDQYHGRPGVGPFQHLIDYVNSRNGLVFWAHPEVKNDWYDEGGGVKIRTDPYHEDLLKTDNYTGFAVFAEGIKYIAPPMGVWDQVLLEYCSGIRKRPAWAIGEVDFEADTFSIKDTQTVLLLKETDRGSIIDALRNGRMYAIHLYTKTAATLFLDKFAVADADGVQTAIMGEDIVIDTNPAINIRISSDRKDVKFNVNLIRNGEVIKKYEGTDAIDINLEDDYYEPGEKVFYRLDINGPSRIISNPIFVQFM